MSVPNLPEHRAEALPSGYGAFLSEIKDKVTAARSRAMVAANAIVITSYWEIGRGVLEREEEEGWGARVIDRLAKDLRREFPDMTGLSPRNLRYMKTLAGIWPEELPQAVATLPWGHVRLLLDKLDDTEDREWYASGAVEHGWSRAVLETQVRSDLRGRKGAALTSFERALPAPDSDLARDALKDPYNFEFLNLAAEAKERDLELALLNDVQKFLMEMGEGFALVGRQFPLRVIDDESGEEAEFFLDLLFFNYKLKRFVVIDLKIEDFKPEFASKMGFYLEAVDELVREPDHEPSIGLILCPGRNKTVTQWALRTLSSPVAVARYTTGDVTLVDDAPAELKPALPALPELASELEGIAGAADRVYDARDEDSDAPGGAS